MGREEPAAAKVCGKIRLRDMEGALSRAVSLKETERTASLEYPDPKGKPQKKKKGKEKILQLNKKIKKLKLWEQKHKVKVKKTKRLKVEKRHQKN